MRTVLVSRLAECAHRGSWAGTKPEERAPTAKSGASDGRCSMGKLARGTHRAASTKRLVNAALGSTSVLSRPRCCIQAA